MALGGDFSLYVVGLAFASQSTILPAFAEHLGAPNIVIGAIPAVTTLGWLLPSLPDVGELLRQARHGAHLGLGRERRDPRRTGVQA